MTNSIPYSLSVPTILTRDKITDAQFDEIMENGLNQAKAGHGYDLGSAFNMISESI